MDSVFAWIGANIGKICEIACVVVAAASFIVKITPTTKDDAFLGKLIKILDHFSLAKTANDKKCIEEAKKNLEGEVKKEEAAK